VSRGYIARANNALLLLSADFLHSVKRLEIVSVDNSTCSVIGILAIVTSFGFLPNGW
jgi:hypothetical protein